MWAVYLELIGIPLVIVGWLLYHVIIKKQPRKEATPDF